MCLPHHLPFESPPLLMGPPAFFLALYDTGTCTLFSKRLFTSLSRPHTVFIDRVMLCHRNAIKLYENKCLLVIVLYPFGKTRRLKSEDSLRATNKHRFKAGNSWPLNKSHTFKTFLSLNVGVAHSQRTQKYSTVLHPTKRASLIRIKAVHVRTNFERCWSSRSIGPLGTRVIIRRLNYFSSFFPCLNLLDGIHYTALYDRSNNLLELSRWHCSALSAIDDISTHVWADLELQGVGAV